MLIDTHCHINIMVKSAFDTPLQPAELDAAQAIITAAYTHKVGIIINVGTSVVESRNCILLAEKYPTVFATVGIHPNDATDTWKEDIRTLEKFLIDDSILNIVGIGECGIDRHYPDYNLQRQEDVFRAQIELAITYNRGLVIHSRDAAEETFRIIEQYKADIHGAVMHCYSYNRAYAQDAINMGLLLGIGGTITYPKNNELRLVVQELGISNLVLETDAPYLPPQAIRGQQNSPAQIAPIAQYIAQLLGISYEIICEHTYKNTYRLFPLLPVHNSLSS